MLIPIVVIAVFSFNDPAGKFNFTWQGFTFEHWSNAFGIPELDRRAASRASSWRRSRRIIATILGTMIAMALVRHEFRGRKAANLLIVIPMAPPGGRDRRRAAVAVRLPQVATGFVTLLIAHVMFSISFVVIVVRSRLIGFDRASRRPRATSAPTRGRRSGR